MVGPVREVKDRVVLAYSGGLDTSVAIKWLQENYDLEVVAVAVDVGQNADFDAIIDKAFKAGAIHAEVVDAKRNFIEHFILPSLKANALYEGKYPLVASLSRPLIAKVLVEVAEGTGAAFLAHGCTGKGNDQVRFEVSFRALNPNLGVIAPIREWKMSREQAIDYAKKHGIPVPVTKESPYSVDENLWGRTIECGALEDPWVEPPEDAFALTTDPKRAPDEPIYIGIGFEKGVPVELDGERMEAYDLIKRVEGLGGEHGFGRVDMMENRLVGIKSREVYEVPAALALIMGHRDLEDLTLDRELLHYKSLVEKEYAEMVYYGLWYSPLKEALDAFVEKTQESVTGTVRLKLYKGSCSVVGRQSPNALYSYELATYQPGDIFSHESAEGFIKLWGLPVETWARVRRR
ncbi:MAG: argininosuccinate synthase [Actinobacteria bacterium]|nr:argininosuccinate synthase [Actinomycetota bacterium]